MCETLEVQINKINFSSGYLYRSIGFSMGTGICIISGSNGSGKSSVLKCICGVLRFSGECRFRGVSLKGDSERYKDRLGYCPDIYSFIDSLSVKEYLRIYKACYAHRLDAEFVGRSMAELGLEQYIRVPVADLSFGTKKKLLIVSSLIPNPELWVLDEPFDGLDAQSAKWLSNELIRRSVHSTIVLTDHALPRDVSEHVKAVVSL